MAKEPYRVEYHVVGMIYLENGRELSGPDFSRLWSSTSVFGRQRAAAGFWKADTSPHEVRVDLGSLEHFLPLLERDDGGPIFGGGTYAKSNAARGSPRDCDFYYAHSDASRC
jgi:hypothetical protein